MKRVRTTIVTYGDTVPEGSRDTIGGTPIVTPQQQPPNCQECGTEMTLYLQFDVREEFELPFQTGSHFVFFSCPSCEESRPSFLGSVEGLHPDFGSVANNGSSVFLNPPGVEEVFGKASIFPGRELKFYQMNEVADFNEYSGEISSGIIQSKIGGVPHWIEYAVAGVGGQMSSPRKGTATFVKCKCGGAFRFLTQIEMMLDFSQDGAGKLLYSGELIVVLACERQCHPYAIGIISDRP